MSRDGGGRNGDSSDKNSPTLNATHGGNGLLAGSNSTCIGTTDNVKESKTNATSMLLTGKFTYTEKNRAIIHLLFSSAANFLTHDQIEIVKFQKTMIDLLNKA